MTNTEKTPIRLLHEELDRRRFRLPSTLSLLEVHALVQTLKSETTS